MLKQKIVEEVYNLIDHELSDKGKLSVAIDGRCGAGKSTLATDISARYECNVFHMDHFFLRPEQRTEERLSMPGGNVDYERFRDEILKGIAGGNTFRYRIFDCAAMVLGSYIEVYPSRLNIIEGSYSMHPELSDFYDLKIFMDIDPEEQSRRILSRNGPEKHMQFINRWIPMENKYFEHYQIKENCDLIILG